MFREQRVAVFLLVCAMFITSRSQADEQRTIVSLDGTWQIAEGSMDQVPKSFDHKVQVPGLADMAQPPFKSVGVPEESDSYREAFWYRREFRIKGPVPKRAQLKIFKAKYGTRVFLNGHQIGDHLPCFTPALLDVREHLLGKGQTNELVIRVGASRKSVPRSIPDGWDFEKIRYIPGIYDSVNLILSGTPHVVRVQTVPDLKHQSVRVLALLQNAGKALDTQVEFHVYEVRSGKRVGTLKSDTVLLGSGKEKTIDVTIPIDNCRWWSPNDPFLYRLETSTPADTLSVRFGMRSFRFDPKTKQAMLNGKPYPLRGTNVCIYRFFEDPARGDLPWQEGWVRQLHRMFRRMNWEAARYCIGFPPEKWYDIADEEGLLIQDEFPIWYLSKGSKDRPSWPKELKSKELVEEYTAWIHERCNHPCVIIWDAQNETQSDGETAKAIAKVRSTDLSNRPWNNGWELPGSTGDCMESHPYIFSSLWRRTKMDANPITRLAQITVPWCFRNMEKEHHNAILVNEYGWLWLSRDGTPTTLTKNVYHCLLGPNATTSALRATYARYLAAMTEYWRSHRKAAGVLHFCALTYSRPGTGQTSDHFLDLKKLTLEPQFEQLVHDAFSPVGLMIDLWEPTLPIYKKRKIEVPVINDLPETWEGKVRLKLLQGDECLWQTVQPCRVETMGRTVLSFYFTTPKKPGNYWLQAELTNYGKKPVQSVRYFTIPPAK